MTTNEARIAACAVALALAACRAEAVNVGVDAGPTDAAREHHAADASRAAETHAEASHVDAVVDAPLAPPVDAGPPCVVGGTTEQLPVTVSCAAAPPGRIAIAGDYVYWTVQGGTAVVGRAPLAGGFPEVVASDRAAAVGLAVDARFVYYTQPAAGRIMRVPLEGGFPVALASGLDMPLLLALDGASLYWTGGHVAAGTVMKLALASDTAPVVLIDGQTSPRAIAVQDGFVYWTDVGDGTILRTSTAGPDDSGVRTASRLATGLVSPTDLVVAGGFAYAPDQAGHLQRVPTAGGPLEDIVDTTGIPYGVATDGLSLYWSTVGLGSIFKLPLPSAAAVATPARDVASLLCGAQDAASPSCSPQNDARFLAVSATAVFWATRGGNAAIHAFAK